MTTSQPKPIDPMALTYAMDLSPDERVVKVDGHDHDLDATMEMDFAGHDHDLDATMEVDFGNMVAETLRETRRRQASRETDSLDAEVVSEVTSYAPGQTTRRRAGLIFGRPGLLTRIVMMGTLALLSGLAVMSALTANAVGDLVAAMRADHRAKHSRVLDEPLPPDNELRDAEGFAAHLAARPDRLAAFHVRRGELFVETGDGEVALRHFRTARLNTATGLTIAQQISEAQAHLLVGQLEVAQDRLETLRQQQLSTEQRQEVMALLGRLYLR